MIIFGPSQTTFGNIFLNLKGMTNLLPSLKVEAKLLWSRNLLQKPLQTTFIFNSYSSVNTPNNSDFTFSDFFNISYISDSDVEQTVNCLHSTTCVTPDEIPNFIITGCSQIFTSFSVSVYFLGVSIIMEAGSCCTYF
jgi:hypothetical protein